MRDNTILCRILFSIITIFILSCKPEEQPVRQETDTRILVKQAFDEVDKMNLNAAFNEERAMMIKTQLDNEKDPGKSIHLGMMYALELLRAGKTKEALDVYSAAWDFITRNNVKMDDEMKRNIYSFIGITFLRHGEIENCLHNHNHLSCVLPIKGEGVHELPYGSTNAISFYERSLEEFPDDPETKYLLNIAYMTLGQYPEKVPAKYRIDPSWFSSKIKMQPFEDVAPRLGLNLFGLAGGTIIDDFDNDGWNDIIVTSWSPRQELVFYKNNGDGSFSDMTEAAGLKGHVGVLNLHQTDINNDGFLDLHLMRGAWYLKQGDIPSTLLLNTGKGSFTDITIEAGLLKYGPTQSSAWADYNLDGWVDLVVAYESMPGFERGLDLYINQKNNTFKTEPNAGGLFMNLFFKGCVATDINNDRYPDIYFSAMGTDNLLFINQSKEGNIQFTPSPNAAQVREPKFSFPCFNFDYDNDGYEDIFISGFSNDGTPLEHWMKSKQGKGETTYLPRLYHNKGNMQFEEVGQQLGLDEIIFSMGCNFGDINVDGFLDFYLGTGNPQYQSLVPNKMYLNMGGQKFEDVSYAGGFANIQKGHGVSFGDLDHDGDEDLYVSIGGAFDGDGFYNTLYENPNTDKNNWLMLDLEGVTANKAGIGARVNVHVKENGNTRKISRTVTSGSSFGNNSLALEIGLGKASDIESVVITWPCPTCPEQTLSDLEINTAYRIVQDNEHAQKLPYTAVTFKAHTSHREHTHH